MPDHLHLVWMGLRLDTDQRDGMKFLREHLGSALRPQRFQHLSHDHVLREHERKRKALAAVGHYILENPFKAELIPRGESTSVVSKKLDASKWDESQLEAYFRTLRVVRKTN